MSVLVSVLTISVSGTEPITTICVSDAWLNEVLVGMVSVTPSKASRSTTLMVAASRRLRQHACKFTYIAKQALVAHAWVAKLTLMVVVGVPNLVDQALSCG